MKVNSGKFLGAIIPEELYEKVKQVADSEERGKLRWATIKLLNEALDNRQEYRNNLDYEARQ